MLKSLQSKLRQLPKQSFQMKLRFAAIILVAVNLVVLPAITFGLASAEELVSGTDVSATDATTGTDDYGTSLIEETGTETGNDFSYLVAEGVDFAFTTSAAVGTELDIGFDTVPRDMMIDWGDGNPVYSPVARGTVLGPNIKIYCDNEVTLFAIEGMNVTSVDVLNSTSLETFICSQNSIESIDLSGVPNLTWLACSSNPITSLDVSNHSELMTLYCHDCNLTTLDLSNNHKMVDLLADNNSLESISYDPDAPWVQFSVSSNNLSGEFVFNDHPTIERLWIDYNGFTSAVVKRNLSLEGFGCKHNVITSVDVSDNPALSFLDVCNNELEEVAFDNLPSLASLGVAVNKLTELDISAYTELVYLNCSYNALTELNCDNNTKLTQLLCNDNNIRFSELPLASDFSAVETFDNGGQYVIIELPETVIVGQPVDISSEYNIDGTISNFKWSDGDGNEVYPTNNNGVFTFGEDLFDGWYHCVITNDLFPGMTMDTTWFYVDKPLPTEPQIMFTTDLPVGSSIELPIERQGILYVDLGDGEMVELPDEPVVTKGDTIKLYCGGYIYRAWLGGVEMTSIDTSNCPELLELNCEANNLTSLDLSNNKNLEILYADDNKFTTLDLSDASKMSVLSCRNNALTSIAINNENSNYETLFITNNKLRFSDLPNEVGNIENYEYWDQPDIQIPETIMVGDSIDLSSEYNVYGTLSEFRWVDWEGTEYYPENNNGVFTFGEELFDGWYHCEIANPLFPGVPGETMYIHTNDVYVDKPLPTEPKLVFTTDLPSGTEVDLSYNWKGTVYIDWGDGEKVRMDENSEFITKGNTIKLYCTGDIYDLWLAGMEMTSIDVSNCPELVILDCSWNNLTSIDLSNNTELDTVYADGNQFASLDLSKADKLRVFECRSNALTSLAVNNSNSNLEILYASDNSLKFSTLPNEVGSIDDYVYADQADIELPEYVIANEEIDLSSEYNIDGTISVYTWYDSEGAVVEPDTAVGGVFTFGADHVGKTINCVITNAHFPELSLATTAVYIDSGAFTVDDDTANSVVDAELTDDFKAVDSDGNVVLPSELILVVDEANENAKEIALKELEYIKQIDIDGLSGTFVCEIDLVDNNHVSVDVESGEVEITINIAPFFTGGLNGYKFNLYHICDDGSIEEISITVNNGAKKITFFADDFSPYILTWELVTTSNDDGDSSGGNASDSDVSEDDDKTSASGVAGDSASSNNAKTGDSQFYILLAINMLILSACGMYFFINRRAASIER